MTKQKSAGPLDVVGPENEVWEGAGEELALSILSLPRRGQNQSEFVKQN